MAAAAHDVDHPGVNQPFLIKTRHHLASLYQVRVCADVCLCAVDVPSSLSHDQAWVLWSGFNGSFWVNALQKWAWFRWSEGNGVRLGMTAGGSGGFDSWAVRFEPAQEGGNSVSSLMQLTGFLASDLRLTVSGACVSISSTAVSCLENHSGCHSVV